MSSPWKTTDAERIELARTIARWFNSDVSLRSDMTLQELVYELLGNVGELPGDGEDIYRSVERDMTRSEL